MEVGGGVHMYLAAYQEMRGITFMSNGTAWLFRGSVAFLCLVRLINKFSSTSLKQSSVL